MADATYLRVGLEDYIGALRRHFEILRDRHQALEVALGPLVEHYQGRGAERFHEVFGAADEQFRLYLERGGIVLGMLRARLEDLNRFDAPEADRI